MLHYTVINVLMNNKFGARIICSTNTKTGSFEWNLNKIAINIVHLLIESHYYENIHTRPGLIRLSHIQLYAHSLHIGSLYTVLDS